MAHIEQFCYFLPLDKDLYMIRVASY